MEPRVPAAGAEHAAGESHGVGNGPAREAGARLLSDPIVRLTLVLFVVLALPLLVPLLPREQLTAYTESADMLLLGLVVLAFGWGLRRVEHREERRFNVYVASAFLIWILVRVSYEIWPDAVGTRAGDIANDSLYLLFYLCLILAIESKPHLHDGWSYRDPSHRVRAAVAAAFVFAMMGYFVVIPSVVNSAAYDTWFPSLCMFVALDLYLAARFLYLRAISRSDRYRPVYGLLAAVALFWSVSDLLETLTYAGVYEPGDGGRLDLLWWLPYLALVLAARLPHHRHEVQERDLETDRTEATLRAVAPQVLAAFLLPALHTACYGFGLLDQESRSARDLLVLFSLPLLGGLVIIQQIVLERRNRGLRFELSEINSHLEQSQRLEAIGRLAGGVAHDFNNLLTAILGQTEMLLERFAPGSPSHRSLSGIDEAGHRAASLTRQLLAFSRRQVLQPKILDLNSVVSEMRELLGRLIGEDVRLETDLAAEPGRVKADPGQLEQVIMNLAINARDAMPSGGVLTLRTRGVRLDVSEEMADIPDAQYVELSVSDTGVGMDRDTQQLVFEPFFTTKERGKGTGLGLSTVYGIVTQSGGHIVIETEPGSGTTMLVRLPLREEPPDQSEPPPPRTLELHGVETILIAEDEESVRELTREILEVHGYRVLEAVDGEQALDLFERASEPIQMLVTDVVMPRMGGPELAGHLLSLQPDLKVLYVSGYTDEAALHDGELDPGAAFLAKPFTPDSLATKVREVFGETDSVPVGPGTS